MWRVRPPRVTYFFAEAYVAMDDLARALQYQARLQDELKCSCESHDMVLMDLKECMPKDDDTREVLDVTRRSLEGARRRTIELKRKADDAQERTRSHKVRCRRATEDHMRAEEVLNNSLGCLCDLVRDIAGATHALS